MSTQADEVISRVTPGELANRSALRPRVIENDKKGQRMTFDDPGSELMADAITFVPEVVPTPRVKWQAAPRHPPQSSVYTPVKRAMDVLGGLAIGLVLSPLILFIALMMCLDDAPILFRHRRIGQGGKTFDCLKFRTMVPHAEKALQALLDNDPEARAEWLRDHKLRNDPRTTRVGRFLRKTSLDELPQLWNVLRGEMSLVGPRPIVKEEMLRYGRYLPTYLAAKPGVTGLWQVTGRNDTDYRRRVVMDTYYVRKQGFIMDLRILFKTVRVVLGRYGAY